MANSWQNALKVLPTESVLALLCYHSCERLPNSLGIENIYTTLSYLLYNVATPYNKKYYSVQKERTVYSQTRELEA